jgi:hypothetical protein
MRAPRRKGLFQGKTEWVAFGRDAAHPMTPNLGQGANSARRLVLSEFERIWTWLAQMGGKVGEGPTLERARPGDR